jgi:hypothetical protein
MLNEKDILKILTFCIDICSFVNNLFEQCQHMCMKFHYTTHVHVSNDMTCWNNFDINEFQSKVNNEMMQYVI